LGGEAVFLSCWIGFSKIEDLRTGGKGEKAGAKTSEELGRRVKRGVK